MKSGSLQNRIILLYVLATVQGFQDNESNRVIMAASWAILILFNKVVMGYLLLRPYILFHIHGPATLHCISDSEYSAESKCTK